jgi:RNA polymerase sigma factor (sigma-70 family)
MKRDPHQQRGNRLPGDHSSSMIDESLLEAVCQLRASIEVEDNFRILESWASPRLLSYFRARDFSHEDAEDLVQKTLVRVYRGIAQLEKEEKFIPWLFTIARNVHLTAARQQMRERQSRAGDLEQAEELPDPKPASWSIDQQLEEKRLKQLWAAIEALPARQRQCLLLQMREEMSYEEIAETLQLSRNTVRNHLAEATKKLQKALREKSEGAAGL